MQLPEKELWNGMEALSYNFKLFSSLSLINIVCFNNLNRTQKCYYYYLFDHLFNFSLMRVCSWAY